MGLEIVGVLTFEDNYVWLIRDPDSDAVAAVDPGEAAPVLAELNRRGWRLSHILLTHHHGDHTEGVAELRGTFGCAVCGAEADARRLPPLDRKLLPGDRLKLGSAEAEVLGVPGHTGGHLAYFFAKANERGPAVFVGDTLFSLGCGRMFEGAPEGFWQSLSRLRALPDETLVYCAHEYTETNLRFARTVDPANPALARRGAEVETLRAAGRPTVPSLLAEEKAANPFLRADDPALADSLGLAGKPAFEVFAELRRRKDRF